MIIPADYQKLDPLPEDPEGCVSYGKQTESALCMVSIYPIDVEDAMDFNDTEALINGIHHTLAENQALIEVENGRRASGFPYIYSIVKTYNGEEEGVGYTLVLDFLLRPNSSVVRVQGFFQEYGITGVRDATVFARLSQDKGFSEDSWCFDPYDPDSQASYMMNQSERAEYDELFPDHPLTQCRMLIRHYKENF
jgi:hypothetical protein